MALYHSQTQRHVIKMYINYVVVLIITVNLTLASNMRLVKLTITMLLVYHQC